MTEKFVVHSNGKITRRALNPGSLYYDGNAFSCVEFPQSDGNYVIRVFDGKMEYVAEEAAPMLDNNVYPSNFQNDDVQLLTRLGMVPVMKTSDLWTTFLLGNDQYSVITKSADNTWSTIALDKNVMVPVMGVNSNSNALLTWNANTSNFSGITLGNGGYVLSNTEYGLLACEVDDQYILKTIGVPQTNTVGLMCYSNRSMMSVDLPSVNGLYGISRSDHSYSTTRVNLRNVLAEDNVVLDENTNGFMLIHGGKARFIECVLDGMNNTALNLYIDKQGNPYFNTVCTVDRHNRLSTNIQVDQNPIPLDEIFSGYAHDRYYNYVEADFSIVIHINDTSVFDNMDTDCFFAISDGKYTYDAFYFKNPMSNTYTVRFHFIVDTSLSLHLTPSNIPYNSITIMGSVGSCYLKHFN